MQTNDAEPVINLGSTLNVEVSPEGLYDAHEKTARQLGNIAGDVPSYEVDLAVAQIEAEQTHADTIGSEAMDHSNADFEVASAQKELDMVKQLLANAQTRYDKVLELAKQDYTDNAEAYVEEALSDASNTGVDIHISTTE